MPELIHLMIYLLTAFIITILIATLIAYFRAFLLIIKHFSNKIGCLSSLGGAVGGPVLTE